MQPKNFKFGGGVHESVVHPIVFFLILVIGVCILAKPRTKIIAPFIAGSILVPMDQVLVLFGFHFPMLRLLALFGIVRLMRERAVRRNPLFTGGINKIDIALMSFAVLSAVAGVLLFQESAVLIFQLGNLYTIFGVYFFLRYLLRGKEDIRCAIRTLAWSASVIAIVMSWEVTTGHNPYALLGGAQAETYATLVARAGRFRAQGCFSHSILAGTFGAIMIPLFIASWWEDKRDRLVAGVGILAATVITITSNSSTPILAYVGGVTALCMWPIRNKMQVVRWSIVGTIATLHMIMKAPVWHLIARIDISGGSSSDHRFQLVDQCIRHFSDWWLIGVRSTSQWGWDMFDTSNQYVAICDNSGLLPFIMFLAIIVYAFKLLGVARRTSVDRGQQRFYWALGAAVFANTVAFLGVSYWDQVQVVWYALLAMISCTILSAATESQTARTARLRDDRLEIDKLLRAHMSETL